MFIKLMFTNPMFTNPMHTNPMHTNPMQQPATPPKVDPHDAPCFRSL